ncbi:hypothetical protein IAT40_000125 [Kwoniella sp. CBS 6097]
MAPNYPWARSQPSGSSSSSSAAASSMNTNSASAAGGATPTQRSIDSRPVVVSVSGRSAQPTDSPAANGTGTCGLGVDSPSTLRNRVASPRYSNTITQANVDVFQSENSNYPSPSESRSKDKEKGKGKRKSFLGTGLGIGSGSGSSKEKKGWYELSSTSPSAKAAAQGLPVPRYDSRGYPTREQSHLADGGYAQQQSPEATRSYRYAGSSRTGHGYDEGNGNGYAHTYRHENGNGNGVGSGTGSIYGQGIKPSRSIDSLSSEVSSTGAGVNEETSRFISSSSDRPTSYYLPSYHTHSGSSSGGSTIPTPHSLYPPTLDYSLSAPSYSPYDNGGVLSNPNPLPSLYGDSRVSLNSMQSGESMTHLRQFDSLKGSGGEGGHGQGGVGPGYGYSNFSISSKGGKRHLADMFSLPADPATWSHLGPEEDDDFHDPDFKPKKKSRFGSSIFTLRGAANLGCLFAMLLVLVVLFAGYPILDNYLSKGLKSHGAYNLGGINATGQIPVIDAFSIIDKDTPQSAYTWTSLETGDEWELVFSDEFNRDGRTFFDGDDPYWQAVDLHYWQTNNLEWYDPRQVTTKDGNLVITLDKIKNHGLDYMGGMIQTWNRFCFTGGYVEASVSLPGTSNVYGLWPAIWTLGNLGRAGYGGTLDGLWPYSYDVCDLGTLPNQTLKGEPALTLTDGDPNYGGVLSYLPGQRLSRCTCENDPTHPGPKLSNGTFRGRSAPEIDMFEAAVDQDTLIGHVSQSAQWAPYNPHYTFINSSTKYYDIYDPSITKINTYMGSVYQQATSGLSDTDQNCYTGNTGCLSVYGFEYSPGDDGYITWVSDKKKAWTIRGPAMGPNADAMVGQRHVPDEPMYLIMNLGISENFGAIDYDGLEALWPVKMLVDYIRVYQDPSKRNIGCDPSDMPTGQYISLYEEAYNNPNITTFDQVENSDWPKNKLVDTC